MFRGNIAERAPVEPAGAHIDAAGQWISLTDDHWISPSDTMHAAQAVATDLPPSDSLVGDVCGAHDDEEA